MASDSQPQHLSSLATARSADPDIHELMRVWFTACNAPSFAAAKSFISPRFLGLYQSTPYASSPDELMHGVATTFVCMAEPFKPFATIREIKDVAPTEHCRGTIKGVYVEFSMLGPDAKEEDVGGRRAKARYWWMRDAEDGLWKMVLEHVDDCGFEMREGEWMGEVEKFIKEQKEKGNWI